MVLSISINGMAVSHKVVAGLTMARSLCEKCTIAIATLQPKKVLPASPINILRLKKGEIVRLKSKNMLMEVHKKASRATSLSGARPKAR